MINTIFFLYPQDKLLCVPSLGTRLSRLQVSGSVVELTVVLCIHDTQSTCRNKKQA